MKELKLFGIAATISLILLFLLLAECSETGARRLQDLLERAFWRLDRLFNRINQQ